MSANQNIFRAGIIPYVINEGTVYFKFMKPSDAKYGGPDWQIAKGRVENDDGNLPTALREGAEELGLKESNIISVTELGVFLGRTCVFICEVEDADDFGPFHYETGDVVWLSLEGFIRDGRELHVPIVQEAHDYILTQIGDRE